MNKSHPLSKKKLQQFYGQGNSLSEIATLFDCSVHKVIYWMQRYAIARRSRSDAAYIKLNPNGDPFFIQKVKSLFLYGLGLGIYWGEGTKVTGLVRVTNSDPAMIKVFREFLIQICGVRDDKIHYSIVAFNDSHIPTVQSFWATYLKISPDKFGKIVQIPPQGKGSYKRKSQFGVCSISVGNIKLKHWIMQELEKIKEARIV